MLNEPASSLDDNAANVKALEEYTEPDEERDPRYKEIRNAVEVVLDVNDERFFVSGDIRRQRDDIFLLSPHSQLLMKFTGQLLMDSEMAYNRLDLLFSQLDLLPVFREDEGDHAIYVLQGRAKPINGGRWLSLILFILTVLSVLVVGTGMALNEIRLTDEQLADQLAQNFFAQLWRGLPYAAAILTILGAHELGHYFMARRHRTAASLPYFLPFPFGVFGTFGAAIRLREPMRNRKVLIDIGAAGPLAGLVFAIPILLIGLATSQVGTLDEFLRPGDNSFLLEGNSIIYALAKILVFGRFLPDGQVDVHVNQLAWAGWTGLLVTGLNLIPVSQLDGGHVLYAFLGQRAKKLFFPIMGLLGLLTLFFANELLVFVVLIFLLGNRHAVPLDDITAIDRSRRILAVATLIIFVLVFVPTPLTPVEVESTRRSVPLPGGSSVWLPAMMMILWTSRHHLLNKLRRKNHKFAGRSANLRTK